MKQIIFSFFAGIGALLAWRGGLPPAAPANEVISQEIMQLQLDAGRTNFLPTGREQVGQEIHLAPRVFVLTKPIQITTAQELIGHGHQTILRWDGPPGTSAISIVCYASHHGVHEVTISNLDIYCPNGADAIALDPSTHGVERVILRDVSIVGGRVNFPGENYACIFDNVFFREPRGQALRLDGQCNVLRSVRLGGRIVGNAVPSSMIEIHGSASFEGFTWLEGYFPCAIVEVNDWKGWHGSLTAGALWIEPHVKGVPTVRLNNADYYGAWASADWPPDNPWVLNNALLHLAPGTKQSEPIKLPPTTSPN